jgi:hypothetical protein
VSSIALLTNSWLACVQDAYDVPRSVSAPRFTGAPPPRDWDAGLRRDVDWERAVRATMKPDLEWEHAFHRSAAPSREWPRAQPPPPRQAPAAAKAEWPDWADVPSTHAAPRSVAQHWSSRVKPERGSPRAALPQGELLRGGGSSGSAALLPVSDLGPGDLTAFGVADTFFDDDGGGGGAGGTVAYLAAQADQLGLSSADFQLDEVDEYFGMHLPA